MGVEERKMKNKTNAQVHNAEMLLALDYLLNHTDKDHPASQQDICRHALEFGLRYDSKATKGNDVRRQRVGDCLQYLQYISDKFKDTDKIPFTINMTENGKFYCEKKNDFTDEEVIKILSAITNDRYTNKNDTKALKDKILNTFSNTYDKAYLIEEVEKNKKNVKKYHTNFDAKLKRILDAYNEGKLITVRFNTRDEEASIRNQRRTYINVDCDYRVYKLLEFSNKPYVILLRVQKKTDDRVSRPLIFDAVTDINIVMDKPLADDFDENRDLDELYSNNSRFLSHYYGNLDSMLKANVKPEGGFAFIVSFYFRLGSTNEEIITRSFLEFFSKKLEYTKCAHFKTLPERNYGRTIPLPSKTDNGILEPLPLKEGETPRYGVCNILVNKEAFLSWVLSDYNNGIIPLIHIAGPTFINEDIAWHYSSMLYCYSKYLSDDSKERLIRKLQRELEDSKKKETRKKKANETEDKSRDSQKAKQ